MMDWLVRQAKDGDGEAFVRLINMYKNDLYKVARGFFNQEADVADAMSAAVLSAYEHIGALREPAYFKTWLTRILINECKDMLSEKKRCTVVESFPEQASMDVGKEAAQFRELIDSLEDKYRILMLLYYGEGFNSREISQILDMNEATVRSRLRRARMKLKAEILEERREVGE